MSSTYSHSSRVLGRRGIEAEYTAAAMYGEPALSDSRSDPQMARAISASKHSRAMSYAPSNATSTFVGSHHSRSSSDTGSGSSRAGSVYSYASSANSNYSYGGGGGPRLHTPSPAYPGHSPVPTPAHSATRVPLPSSSSSTYSATPRAVRFSTGAGPTPTPRHAAGELLARVASVQSQVLADAAATRHGPPSARSVATHSTRASTMASGPPLVVRSPSPTPSTSSVRSHWSYHAPTPALSHHSSHSSSSSHHSHRSSRTNTTPTPSRPLSPLDVDPDFYLRTPSVRSARTPSLHSVCSSASGRSATSIRSATSRQSLLASLTHTARHAPLSAAVGELRRAASASASASSRAGSVRSSSSRLSTASSSRSAAEPEPERTALARLHALLGAPTRCARPGCGALIPGVGRDTWCGIAFPPPTNADPTTTTFNISTGTGPPPIPQTLLAALHARCPVPGCGGVSCRGCGAALSPSSLAFGSAATHCAPVRALGAVAALVAFDRAHAYSAAGGQAQGRETDKPLLGPLNALVYFLAPPPAPMATPRPSPQMPGGMLLLAVPEDPREDEREGDRETEMDAALPALLRLSRVLGYVAGLLRAGVPPLPQQQQQSQNPNANASANVDVGTWMARAPAYGAVLRLLRAVGDATGPGGVGRAVLTTPVPVPLHAPAGNTGLEEWVRSGKMPRGHGQANGEALVRLIRALEPARGALLRLAGATRFGPTVEKAHALCDGVLYVLLQDVLGEGDRSEG
ncbi:hypothetical protein C8R46DRAFT_1344336 [Mycena filopes]|nr:hypothetical protein C8R46DRAFT_1344336 [Mycena filopes]